MLSFEEVKSVFVAIQSNPALYAEALRECEALYSEEFIGAGSEFTGADILSQMDLSNEHHVDDLQHYLRELVQVEQSLEQIKRDLKTDDINLAYIELMKRAKQSRNQYKPFQYHEEYDFDDGDDDPSDNEYRFYDQSDDDHFYEEYLPDYVDNCTLDSIIGARYDELLEKFKNTVYVVLVNYKGEGEGESMLIKVANLRKFYSKYNYG